METQYSCIEMKGKVLNCTNCYRRNRCTIFHYIGDLSAIRIHCTKCHRETKEEHVRYCPFCGYKVLDVPLTDDKVKPHIGECTKCLSI